MRVNQTSMNRDKNYTKNRSIRSKSNGNDTVKNYNNHQQNRIQSNRRVVYNSKHFNHAVSTASNFNNIQNERYSYRQSDSEILQSE
jgi:hypothetical protein